MPKAVLWRSRWPGWRKLGVTNTVRAARPFYRRGAGVNDSAVPAQSVRYFSLPGGWGLSSSGAFLFARLLPEIRRLHELRSCACDSRPFRFALRARCFVAQPRTENTFCGHRSWPGCVFYPASWRLRRRMVRPRVAIRISHRALGDLCERKGSGPGDRGRRNSGKHDRFVQRGRPTNVFSSGQRAGTCP